MPNPSIPATGEAMPVVNRRTAMAGIAALAATSAAPANAAPTSGLSPLIEAHRRAEAALNDAIDLEWKAEAAYEASPPQKHLVMTTPGNFWEVTMRSARPWWEIRDNAREQIASTFDRLRRAVPRELNDEIRAASLRDLNRQQVGAYRRLVTAINAIYDEQERKGYLSAYMAAREATEAEIAALMAVCAYPCRNMAEVAEKARYIGEYGGGLDGYPEHLTAFVESMFSEN